MVALVIICCYGYETARHHEGRGLCIRIGEGNSLEEVAIALVYVIVISLV